MHFFTLNNTIKYLSIMKLSRLNDNNKIIWFLHFVKFYVINMNLI